MKYTMLLPLLAAFAIHAETTDTAAINRQQEALQAGLSWKTGEITLPGGKAVLHLPAGYRYIDPSDAKTVLEKLWGNPSGEGTLGMVFGPGQEPLTDGGWGAVLNYSDDGHIDDADAAKTDFGDLLKDMQKSTEEGNEERTKQGYDKVTLHGWAEAPHFDAAGHKLFWAKDLEFAGNSEHTLNYYVRVLGREGVLEINAVSITSQLAKVKEGMAALNAGAEFTAGNRYADFNKGTDRVSKLGFAALIAGGAGVAAKAGLFKWLIALLIIGKKFVVIGLLGIGAAIKAWWSSRKKKAENERFGRE